MDGRTDIEIAQACRMRPIVEVAAEDGIEERYVEPYGRYKAKVDPALLRESNRRDGKLILVTAMTPTAAGEGKTTTAIGLADGLRRIGLKAAAALREPSLGPVFGIKGGAAGGGRAQVVPMEDINLHFTGDFHAVGAANNLLAAMLDNHIHHGNALGVDTRRIVWKRCMDMNDRQLRCLVDGLGGRANGVPREDGFDITAASEIMAILCLFDSPADLRRRLAAVIAAYDRDGRPVTAGGLRAAGAMAALLRDAAKPNLAQTLEGTPVFIHGGPFANIAHGCNSIAATRLAMRTNDYTVTEAGFGADLGAEKFLDIKCRAAGIRPDAVVVVASARALKAHGGLPKDRLAEEDLGALAGGMPNLLRHVSNMRDVYGLPCLVAVNVFPSDTERERALIIQQCAEAGVQAVACSAWADGGRGAEALARAAADLCEAPNDFRFAYELDGTIEGKVERIVRRIYGGDGVAVAPAARREMDRLTALGFSRLPVCVAKTQYSFTDDPARLGAPGGFTVTVRDVRVYAGAGFVVALTGDILTMPGLPKVPAAEAIDVREDGAIVGLF